MEFEIDHFIQLEPPRIDLGEFYITEIKYAFLKFSPETLELWISKMKTKSIAEIFGKVVWAHKITGKNTSKITNIINITMRLKLILDIYKKYFPFDTIRFSVPDFEYIYVESNNFSTVLSFINNWEIIKKNFKLQKIDNKYYSSEIFDSIN